jgi:hypothetical protein
MMCPNGNGFGKENLWKFFSPSFFVMKNRESFKLNLKWSAWDFLMYKSIVMVFYIQIFSFLSSLEYEWIINTN